MTWISASEGQLTTYLGDICCLLNSANYINEHKSVRGKEGRRIGKSKEREDIQRRIEEGDNTL